MKKASSPKVQVPPSAPPPVSIPILLLEEEPDPLPRWMAHYKEVSYVLHGIHILYSWVYLGFVAYIQFVGVLHIQYRPVNDFLTYNSYSILCPMLCSLFVGILIFHIRYRVKLDDGEFFGFIGILMLLCMITCYDATGVYNLYNDRGDYIQNKSRYIETVNPVETDELAWQYAWSTKPTCARVHARKTLQEKLENDTKRKEFEENNAGPPLFHPEEMGKINSWMYSGLNKLQLQAGFLEIARKNVPNDEGTVDEKVYKSACKQTANSIEKQRHRDWMEAMQKQLKCCGPRGYEDWKNYVKDMEKCHEGFNINNKKYTQGCAKPFSQHLRPFLLAGTLIMFGETFFYVLTIILACFHFAAMKYDERRIAKEYSLLDLSPPEGLTIIDIKKDEQGGNQGQGVSSSDPVQSLFFRGATGRMSTIETHLPLALTINKDPKIMRRLSILSHAVNSSSPGRASHNVLR